ncbi:MAG: dGTP triphosphohydrolase [Thermoanaerobaculaceae bacterium]
MLLELNHLPNQPISDFRAEPEDTARLVEEPPPAHRCHYSRDRDRVLHSKEFRRLAGKTQVFVSGFDDHFRTRLTHTLEVSQIARTIARALGLNELLTEAIALAHDVGHTPFGHVGERWLSLIMSGCYALHGFEEILLEQPDQQGFRHNWQGVRAVRRLEEVSPAFEGLNLTNQTVWGILNHTKLSWKDCPSKVENRCTLLLGDRECAHPDGRHEVPYYRSELVVGAHNQLDDYWTFEGLVVSLADEIAQRHHDIEDGVRAGILSAKEVKSQLKDFLARAGIDGEWRDRLDSLEQLSVEHELAQLSRFVVDLLASQAIDCTRLNLAAAGDTYTGAPRPAESRQNLGLERARRLVGYPPDFAGAEHILQAFLKERVLNSYLAQSMDGKAGFVIRQLFKAFLTNPEQLPDRTVTLLQRRYEQRAQRSRKETPNVAVGKAREWLRKKHDGGEDRGFRTLLLRTICDFLAGMTDNYAMHQFEVLYGGQIPRRAIIG